jgi:hypothetical protein
MGYSPSLNYLEAWRLTKMKKNVLISFITEADTDLEAVSELRKIMYLLPENIVSKFEAFDILEVAE